MQCRSRPLGVWRTRSAKKSTKFSDLVESVTQPAIPPSWTSRAAKSTAVPLRLYSNSRRTRRARDGRLGRVDPRLGLHARLLVHAPHHGVGWWIEVEPAHVRRLLPEVRVVAGHPGLDLPGLEVERLADAPGLRGRHRHAVGGHGRRPVPPSSSGSHPLAAVLGHQLDEQQHVVVAIDVRAPGALLVFEPGQAELAVALPPDPDLVVVHPDRLGDVAIGPARRRPAARCAPVGQPVPPPSPTARRLPDRARSPRLSFSGASRIGYSKPHHCN